MEKNSDDKVPLFKSWNHWYILVVLFLVALILFFYLLTKTYS
ncbi:MAG TPA: hypothetical protein VHK91_07085 [Flavisolibacter sp.]|nr:hypothetical protein [Flavisolibacter sp.]